MVIELFISKFYEIINILCVFLDRRNDKLLKIHAHKVERVRLEPQS
jgi:hypothetical protein